MERWEEAVRLNHCPAGLDHYAENSTQRILQHAAAEAELNRISRCTRVLGYHSAHSLLSCDLLDGLCFGSSFCSVVAHNHVTCRSYGNIGHTRAMPVIAPSSFVHIDRAISCSSELASSWIITPYDR